MISRDEIYSECINLYLDSFELNRQKFRIIVAPTEDMKILPVEAFSNGCVVADFDYGAEETWTTDQILIEDNMFNCVLVYRNANDEWIEYDVSFPISNILYITKTDVVISSEKLEFDKDIPIENLSKSKEIFKYNVSKTIQDNLKG